MKRWLNNGMGFAVCLCALWIGTLAHGQDDCPGEGSCFVPHPTPGCDDEACCLAICANDSYCCIVDWDQSCANQAATTCAPEGA
jgi:hypothetical protein